VNIAVVYHGRQITLEDITFMKETIANDFDKSRRFISKELCRQWNRRQQNGALKDMICGGLLSYFNPAFIFIKINP
jgi:hypothetical protein